MNFLSTEILRPDAASLNVTGIVHIDRDYPELAGHFPDFPILAGVSQIKLVRVLAEAALERPLDVIGVERAKFLAMACPPLTLEIQVRLPVESAAGSREGSWVVCDGGDNARGNVYSKGRIRFVERHDRSQTGDSR